MNNTMNMKPKKYSEFSLGELIKFNLWSFVGPASGAIIVVSFLPNVGILEKIFGLTFGILLLIYNVFLVNKLARMDVV